MAKKAATKKKRYLLTQTAESDFREAKRWSLARWGNELTTQYFSDLHDAAQYVAENVNAMPAKEDLTGIASLGVHAVREHYLIYVPVKRKRIVIVALIRQTRDVPAIIKTNQFFIERELKEILHDL